MTATKDDVTACVNRLIRQHTTIAAAAEAATERAFELPPGSPGRAFWIEVLSTFGEMGVTSLPADTRSTYNPLPFTVEEG